MKHFETERLPDGRLRLTLDERGEATILAMASMACDVVVASTPVDRVEAKLASIQGHLDRAQELAAEPLIFPPPLRSERLATAAEVAELVHEAETGDGQKPWIRWPGSQLFFKADGVSGRPGNPQPVIHYIATNGDVIGRQVSAGDTFPICTDGQMIEAEGRAA